MKIFSTLGIVDYLLDGHHKILQLDEPNYVMNVTVEVVISILTKFPSKYRTWIRSIDFCK
jgi:hypothetical protein